MPRIGAHFHVDDPLAEATAAGAQAVQFFLGDPQGWKGPVIPGGDPAAVRSAYAEAGVDVYIHAPYVINVATSNNRIRIPSRKLLTQQLAAAASIGARGLIVHGGHVTAGTDIAEGVENWRKAVERIERPLPMLIENTAGGDWAMARSLEAIGRLWDAVTDAAGDDLESVGFCLDTCHANSAGIDLADVVDRVKAITGRIDLVHCNNSRDDFGSGRDRHANLTSGTIDPALLLGVVRGAGATAICETPAEDGGLAADVSWLQERLGAGRPERAGA
jgi:deoxyribonuclease-4